MSTFRLLILIILLVSCNQRDQPAIVESATKQSTLLSPDSSRGQIFSKSMKNITSELNLTELTKGVDSLEFRIWNSCTFVDKLVYIAKFTESGLSVTRLSYQTRYPTSEEKKYDTLSPDISTIIVDSSRSEKVLLKANSKMVFDSLLIYDIAKMPSQHEIPNFQDNMADGCSFTIEIATKSYYKSIYYHCPDFYAKKGEPYNRKILNFLSFLYRNLSMSFFYCYP